MIPCVIRQNSQIASRTTFAVVFSEMWTFTCLLETYILVIYNCSSILKVGCNLLRQPLHLSFYLCAREMVEDSSACSYLSQWSWHIAECVASLVKLEFYFDL